MCVWVGARACSLWNELRLWVPMEPRPLQPGVLSDAGSSPGSRHYPPPPPRKMGQWSPGEVKGARKCAEDMDRPGPENTPLGEPVPPAITDKPGFLTGPLMKKR